MPMTKACRRLLTLLLASLLAVPLTVLGGAAPAGAAVTLPPGFSLVDLPSGQTELLTDFAWTPDGGYFTTGKNGRLAWVSPTGAPRTVATLDVDSTGDLGLVGVTLAPDYATSHTVYLSRATSARHLRVDAWTVQLTSGQPTSITNSRTVIDIPGTGAQHALGTVIAPADGTLWIAIGDNASPSFVDPQALRSLDLNEGFGKLLHMYPDGRGVASNPFYDSANPTSWRSRAYATGFRSPFRFSLDPATGGPVLGDVGWNDYEEVDIIRPGSSYGWPCWEGSHQTVGYRDLDACQGVGTAMPLWDYPHGPQGSTVIGGIVYTGTAYPAQYQGAYFFGDYVSNRLYSMTYDGTGRLTREPEANGFGSSIGAPVKFAAAPNGDIVYADIGSSKVRRLIYAAGNRAPVAAGTTSTNPSTLTVTFDGSASYDLDGDPLTYAWAFGDGTTGNGVHVTHQYAAPGTSPVTATLTVRDPLGASDSTSFTVVPANHTPVVTINRPPAGTVYRVGDTISLTGTANDAEDGPLTVHWTSKIVHCSVSTCHEHVGTSTDGPSYSAPFEDHGDNTKWVVTASATDSRGAVASDTYTALPMLRRITVNSNTPAAFTINGFARQQADLTVGATVTVTAPVTASDGVASFSSWTDGAPRTRTLTMPQNDLTLTAVYSTPIDQRYASDAAFRALMGTPTGPEIGDANLRYRDFTGGRAYWTPSTGVHEVHGACRTAYLAAGGHVRFGAPVNDQTPAPDGIGAFNDFTGTSATGAASCYSSPSTGGHMVNGDIRTTWLGLGGVTGPNGYPVTDEGTTVNGRGRYNNFQNGAIYWLNSTIGAHSVYGGIFDKYAALGWDSSILGFPLTDETGTADGVGRFNHFEFGSIYWTPSTNAHEVHGDIRTRWFALGAEQGPNGYPVTDEGTTGNGRGRFNNFQNGAIYWLNSTIGAHSVHGYIFEKYAALGWDSSILGFPLTDETGTPDGVGRYNHFELGSIYWTPSTNAHEVHGAIRTRWAELGWEKSYLKYPITDEFSIPGGRRSNFQGGSISWNASTGQTTDQP
ncbi:PQQ-dependent sugar dehydrogenase [Yinghuangia seranimata]|uniref:PQQ-dependent sugar dehydrogenase n=1 Tax=Yinghuangia seranimata TaxID=408067 RepID=UPI00248ADFD1|nr:PQQ-dependent sugar dehydrogenase [Yinghuangia seranimata]MDI2129835.1 PQQ-dependent sugar dehydrogenase [Yinghuangia seranimata]